jgi:hypothetical protein
MVYSIFKVYLATSHAGSSLAYSSTLKMEAVGSSETSVHTRSTRSHVPEDSILQLAECSSRPLRLQAFNITLNIVTCPGFRD